MRRWPLPNVCNILFQGNVQLKEQIGHLFYFYYCILRYKYDGLLRDQQKGKAGNREEIKHVNLEFQIWHLMRKCKKIEFCKVAQSIQFSEYNFAPDKKN